MSFAVGGAAWRGGWRPAQRGGWRTTRRDCGARGAWRVSVSVVRSAAAMCTQQRALYKGY